MKIIYSFNFVLFLIYGGLSLVCADELLHHRLESEVNTGNCRGISSFCREQVRQKLDGKMLDNAVIGQVLEDQDFVLIAHVGYYFSLHELQQRTFCNELKDKEFTKWLLGNRDIFKELAFANKAASNTFEVLYAIWKKENKQLDGPILNLALGAALNAGEYTLEELLAKFDFYKHSWASGKLFPQFESLRPWEMALVLKTINNIGHLDDFEWAQEYLSKRSKITASNIGQAACGLIPYRMKNKKGVSVHAGGVFYDNKPITLKLYTEYGGVCGAVSKGSSGFCRSKGVPSYPIGQPGHCALIWKTAKGTWNIGNNVCGGWNWSEGNGGIPWRGPTALIQVLEHFIGLGQESESMNGYYCSEFLQQPASKDKLLEYALKKNVKNYPAWQSRLSKLGKRLDDAALFKLAAELNAAFGDEPAVLEHLFKQQLIPRGKSLDLVPLAALLLNEQESADSQDIYFRNLWPQACKEIHTLQKSGIRYDYKSRGGLLKDWSQYNLENKISGKVRKETCAFLEKTIASLKTRKKTHAQVIDLYMTLLAGWKDKALMLQAESFVDQSLKNIDHASALRNVLDFGIKIGQELQDEKILKKYRERIAKSES